MKKYNILIPVMVILLACSLNTKQSSATFLAGKFQKLETSLVSKFIARDSVSTYFNTKNRKAYNHVPSVCIAIGDTGKAIYERAFGVKDSRSKNPVDEHIRPQTASLSKAITAIGLLRLVEKYELSLDNDINKHLVEWKRDCGLLEQDTVSKIRLFKQPEGLNSL